jgi:hypothetical protein
LYDRASDPRQGEHLGAADHEAQGAIEPAVLRLLARQHPQQHGGERGARAEEDQKEGEGRGEHEAHGQRHLRLPREGRAGDAAQGARRRVAEDHRHGLRDLPRGSREGAPEREDQHRADDDQIEGRHLILNC